MSLPFNHHPHSRYVLKEAPWGYMSADLIHNDITGPVFDLGVDLDDRHGIAFIRISDVEEMARVLGMATKDEVIVLKRRIDELNAEVLNVPREVESLKDGLSVLVSDFLDRVVPRVDSDSSLPVPEEVSDGQSEFDFEESGTDDKDSGQSSDASGDKRPAKLSSDKLDGFGFDSIK